MPRWPADRAPLATVKKAPISIWFAFCLVFIRFCPKTEIPHRSFSDAGFCEASSVDRGYFSSTEAFNGSLSLEPPTIKV